MEKKIVFPFTFENLPLLSRISSSLINNNNDNDDDDDDDIQ